jgi:hypothetical protein
MLRLINAYYGSQGHYSLAMEIKLGNRNLLSVRLRILQDPHNEEDWKELRLHFSGHNIKEVSEAILEDSREQETDIEKKALQHDTDHNKPGEDTDGLTEEVKLRIDKCLSAYNLQDVEGMANGIQSLEACGESCGWNLALRGLLESLRKNNKLWIHYLSQGLEFDIKNEWFLYWICEAALRQKKMQQFLLHASQLEESSSIGHIAKYFYFTSVALTVGLKYHEFIGFSTMNTCLYLVFDHIQEVKPHELSVFYKLVSQPIYSRIEKLAFSFSGANSGIYDDILKLKLTRELERDYYSQNFSGQNQDTVSISGSES